VSFGLQLGAEEIPVLDFARAGFLVTVEAVPPRGPQASELLAALTSISALPFRAFSVATHPVARPHMDSLSLCSLLMTATGKEAVLHCTPRDHNRLALQGLLWGARALGIGTVLVASGDRIALEERGLTGVYDLDVFRLIRMAAQAGLQAGVVLDPRPERGRQGLVREAERLLRKAEAGAGFVVTQPVYSPEEAAELAEAARPAGLPVLLGVLPLRTAGHAEFLNARVAGIRVPDGVLRRMREAADPPAEGLALARRMLAAAREYFAGACLMPPFGHYEILRPLLA
jgi:methylenetetrahydrofolate reductase (NADPH)